MPPKNTQQKNTEKRKVKQNPSDTFLAKSRAAALNQSRIHMEKQQNRSFIKTNEEEILKSPTVEVITISDSTQNSPLKIYTSDNKYDFMITSQNNPEIPSNFISSISTPNIDKAVTKIQKLKTTPTLTTSLIPNKAIPDGIPTTKKQEPSGTNTSQNSNDIIPTSCSKTTTENVQAKEDKSKEVQNNERNEEHFEASASSGKSSISDTKPGEFYEEEFHE